MLVVLGIVFALPWLVIGVLMLRSQPALEGTGTATAPATVPAEEQAITALPQSGPPATAPSVGDVIHAKPGAWGLVDSSPIVIELPEEYVFVPPADHPPIRWTFSGFTKERALDFLVKAKLTPQQLSTLREAKWETTPAGVAVEPGDAIVLSLSPESRKTLYDLLVTFPENAKQIDPYWFREGQVDFRLRGSELAPETNKLLNSLLYPAWGDLLLFADVEVAIRAIPDTAEKKRFMRAVTRKKSLFLRLQVNADSNTESLAEYWGVGGRQKDLLPVLNALRYNASIGLKDGTRINAVYLLPPFARDRLYKHAFSNSVTGTVTEDCFWSAFNFFSTEPDNKVNDFAYAAQVLQRDYYAITEPAKLGDLILLVGPNNEAVHAATYIADDILFTKNGGTHLQPWILMYMQDMLDTYRIKTPGVRLMAYRKRSI